MELDPLREHIRCEIPLPVRLWATAKTYLR